MPSMKSADPATVQPSPESRAANNSSQSIMAVHSYQTTSKSPSPAGSPHSLGLWTLGFTRHLVVGLLALLASCKESTKGTAAGGGETANTPAGEVAPLDQTTLTRVANAWGIVHLNDGTHRQGIVIQTGQSTGGRYDYVVLAAAPDSEKRIDFAMGSAKAEFSTAVRQGRLKNGLGLFGFSSTVRLAGFKRHAAAPGIELHAIRLSPSGPQAASEAKVLREQLDQKLQEKNQELRAEAEQRRASPRTASGARQPRSPRMTEIFDQADRLKAQLNFASQSIAAAETAAGSTVEKLSGSQAAWENTVLVGQDLRVFAIRHGGQWVKIDEALDSVPACPKGVKLMITGTNSSVQLTCLLKWEIPPASASFSLVAATTHELESQAGGTLEERLTKVAAEAFRPSGSNLEITKSLTWSGAPTTLWIRVMDGATPGQPLIDEAISLEYDNSFVAKWVKPPSPLIEIPQGRTDTPEDLVKDRAIIETGGTVLDLISTADAALLLVRTDQPPFWASLDLKTGTVGKVPWTSTSDTLVATQAGKTYVANRKTKEVEIWDDASSKRETVRLLALPGELISLAAPKLAPGCPVLVATSQTAAFVNPATFKVTPCWIDLAPVFSPAQDNRLALPKLDPATLRVRATSDGAIYTLSGMDLESSNSTLRTVSMHMTGGIVVANETVDGPTYLPSVGRNLLKGNYGIIPDQGGGDLSLTVERRYAAFPALPGSIEFKTEKGRGAVGVLESAPFVPAFSRRDAAAVLACDRRLYLDTRCEVLLIPEAAKIHLLHLKLPEVAALVPDCVFSGETVAIPLPPGTGHRATSSGGDDVAIAGKTLTWRVPDKLSRVAATLQLDWTGELGSAMTRKMDFSTRQAPPRPVVVSADGSRAIALNRRTLISNRGNSHGIAGAGHVLLVSDGDKTSAWSLVDGHRLCEIDHRFFQCFGDADRLYGLDRNGLLSGYDLRTGKLLQSKQFGNASNGSQQGLVYLTTGSASRGPLVAIAVDHDKRYFAQIDRETLALELLDFGTGTPPQPTYRLQSNASGSVCWSFSCGIFRQEDRVTVKQSNGAIEGSPDASGRYLVDHTGVMDLGRTPSEKLQAKDLPGASAGSSLLLDHSGRYLLVTDYNLKTESSSVSVRRLADGFKEVFKINYAGRVTSGGFHLISSTKTLVTLGHLGSGHFVYDLDCEAIERELASPGPTP